MWNLLRMFLLLCFSIVSTSAADANNIEECKNPEAELKVRLVTPDELSTKTGENGTPIWLSVMGHVFDVSEGADFYGKASSYGAFAGRDASVCFCTGVFTKEEAEKGTELIPLNQLPGLHEWLEFYKKHDKYSFIGHLVDPRYFDENGAQTKRMKGLYERLETILAEQEAKKKKRIKS